MTGPAIVRHCECGCGRVLPAGATRYRVHRRYVWRARTYRCATRIAARLDRPAFEAVALLEVAP